MTVPGAHVSLAKQLAGDIALNYRSSMNKFPDLPLGHLCPADHSMRGCRQGLPTPVRPLVPLALEPGLWSLVAGRTL